MARSSNKSARPKKPANNNPAGALNPAIDALLGTYQKPVRIKLLALRRLIFDTAKTTEGVVGWRKP